MANDDEQKLINALTGEEDEVLSSEEDVAFTGKYNLNKVLKFLKDYANKGELNKGVDSKDIADAIEEVNETYGFVDSYPPLSEKLAIIANDREGYRLLLTGYNPLEIEKEKFDALVNDLYSDRLVSDKNASVYYAYRDGLKAFERDMAAAAAAAATMIQRYYRRHLNNRLEQILKEKEEIQGISKQIENKLRKSVVV